MDQSDKTGNRTTVTINRHIAKSLKDATVEATKRAGVPIKQADLVNYLLKHHLTDAIEGVLKERGL